ncbi:alpha/beta hydrolase [Oceanicella sp. SM1341]|uniref:alpha/beta hydrolase n=1 Tax=Oceanicella sp. SM1341 TaxID=1548889 RepID=UPI000E4CA70B|nr:alpha/beta hydrolase [Oceanicella sp. SM1341]
MPPFRLLGALLALLLGCGAAAAGEWHETDCPPGTGHGPDDRVLRCGIFTPGGARAQAGQVPVRLLVNIFHAQAYPAARLAPVVYLSGGPGQDVDLGTPAGVARWQAYLRSTLSWAEGRDVIVVGQRGLSRGLSPFDPPRVPDMECRSLADPRIWLGARERPDMAADAVETSRIGLAACLRELTATGFDLAAYDTVQSATDLAELRAALGIRAWVVFGVSYGTRLGLELIRQDGAGVEAAVLDSVFPPQVTDHWTDAAPFDRALERMLAACRADAPCAAAYPDLGARLDGLLARLAAAPMPLRLNPAGDIPELWIRLDDAALLDMIFTQLYWVWEMERLPRAIDALDRGELDTFRRLLVTPYVEAGAAEGWSYGLQIAVSCNDDGAWFAPEKIAAQQAAHPRLASWIGQAGGFPLCEGWPMRPRSDGFSEPVVSDVPVLLMAGDLDPVTPPDYAQRAAEGLSRSEVHVAPGSGHSVLDQDPCARGLVEDFLARVATGEAAEEPGRKWFPDEDCAGTPVLLFDLP